MAAFLSVLSTLLAGVILTIAPWTSLWEASYMMPPLVREVLSSAFTRGGVSGLGIVNLLLAVQEAHHHIVHGREIP